MENIVSLPFSSYQENAFPTIQLRPLPRLGDEDVARNNSGALRKSIGFSSPEVFSVGRDGKSIVRTVKIGKYSGSIRFRAPQMKFGADRAGAFDKAWLMAKSKPRLTGNGPHIRVIDLFAGCGGLSVGVQEAVAAIGGRFESVYASDIDEGALSVYSSNLFPAKISSTPIEESVGLKLDASLSRSEKELRRQHKRVDFLIGGPPCQGHSDLNNHTRRNDPRNELYGIMGRAATIFNPRYIIIENVVGVQHASTSVAQKTVRHLDKLGYQTVSIMLNAADFGVAQNRKRHFTLGMMGSIEIFRKTLVSLQRPKRPVMWAIDDLIDEADNSNDTFCTSATHSSTNKKRIDFLFDKKIYELPDSQRPDCHRLKPHAYKSVYGRMRPDSQAPTITSGFGSTGQGRFVHPLKRRTLTPHEAARVQFFPDWFSFGEIGRRQLQKYIGNAVPPKLGYVLALALLNSEVVEP